MVNFLLVLTPHVVILIISSVTKLVLYPIRFGGEPDSTGVWKLKWRAGDL